MGGMFGVSSKGKLADIRGFSQKDKIPYPLAFMIASGEAMACVSLISGILPRAASVGIMTLMSGTIYKHIVDWKSPFWAKDGGWEYDLIWLTLASTILSTGAGDWTIPRLIQKFEEKQIEDKVIFHELRGDRPWAQEGAQNYSI
jgi:uncharacterized membrane protein YphA (DoxX/SURF4 family)